MNVHYMTIRMLFLVGYCLGLLPSLSAQVVFKAQKLEKTDVISLEKELTDYTIIRLDSRAMLAHLQQKNNPDITIEFAANQAWTLRLQAEDIRAEGYQLQIASAEGVARSRGAGALTFGGNIVAPEPGICRLTVNDNFIYGVFQFKNETWYIEPARRSGQTAGADAYLLYKNTDVLPNPDGMCAAVAVARQKMEVPQEKTLEDCFSLDIALAADYKMFVMYGNTETLENYVLGILNNVHANYAVDFAETVRFRAITLYVSTCEFCDPWEPGFGPEPVVNYLDYLRNFRDWGNNNGFGINVNYSVASLWTGREMTDADGNNIGGGGYYGGMCGNLRYNVLRRYSESASLMRTLQAHELGHNFDAEHDPAEFLTIMAPRIRDTQAWSTTSKNVINTFINRTVLGTPGCTKGCVEQSLPQAQFTVQSGEGCAPFLATFTNQSLTSGDSWAWHFPGGTPATSLAENPTVRYDQPGVYDVQLIVTNQIGQDTLTQPALIRVLEKPTAVFTANTILGETAVAFTNETTDANSVVWDFGDGVTSEQTAPVHEYAADGTYEVRMTATNACGTDEISEMITIVTSPQAEFAAMNTVGCAPLQVQFENQSSTNAETFTWTFAGGTPATSTMRSPQVNFATPGTYEITLTARNAADENVARKSGFVTVLAKPQANFTFVTDEKTVRFSDLSTNADQVRWEFGDGSVSQAAQPEHFYAEAGTYEVLLIASNECGSDTSRQTLQIGGLAPIANFAADVVTGCAPFTVQFFGNTSSNATRRWYFPGGEPAFSTAESPLIEYTARGNYPVAFAVENIWGMDSVFVKDYINVRSVPRATFDWQIDAFDVAFQPDEASADGQYHWDFGDGNTSTQATPTHTYARSGVYEVELVATNLCGISVTRKKLVLQAIPVLDTRFITEARIMPNPSNGQFQLSLRGTPQAELEIEVVNLLGEIVQQRRADFSGGDLEVNLGASSWQPGWYWLRIRSDGAVFTRPIVIQKP